MKQLAQIFTALSLCLAPLATLPADPQFSSGMFNHSSEANVEVGNFPIVAIGFKRTLFLGGKRFYTPVKKLNKVEADKWRIGDVIRVLKTKRNNHFILVNQRSSETTEAKKSPHVQKTIGPFTILARGDHHSVLLTNNVFYRPSNKVSKETISSWKVGDVIFVSKKGGDKYLLVNASIGRGGIIKTKLLRLTSSHLNSWH